MSAQLAAFLAWANAWAPMFTAAAGGGLALTSALLLFLIATALGPDVHVFPCLDQRARFWAFLTSFSWFIRGVMVLTSVGTADARKPHWDMPFSWMMTTVLLALVLVYIWAQRMPAEVRARFDRRQAAKRAEVKSLAAEGRLPEAKLAAEGGAGGLYRTLGVSAADARKLNEQSDPYA